MRCLFLINPYAGAGAGKAVAEAIEEESGLVRGMSVQLVFTDPVRLQQQVISLVPDIDLIVAAGGDGTVSFVAQSLALLPHPPPLAVLPLGTGNDLARALGWLSWWRHGGIQTFMAGLKSGEVRSMDLWSLGEGHSFLGYAGIGMDARIVQFFTRWRRLVPARPCCPATSQFLYVLAGLKYLSMSMVKRQVPTFSATLFRGRLREEIHSTSGMVIGNIPYYAGGGRLSGDSRFDDGILEVYRIDGCMDFLSLLVKGRMPGQKGGSCTMKADALQITSISPLPQQVDGEWIGLSRANMPIDIERTRSVPVLVPPEDPLVRERYGKKGKRLGLETKGTPVPGAATRKALSKNVSGATIVRYI